MTQIIRIETRDGHGLYGSGNLENSIAEKLKRYFPFEGSDVQPPPSKDGLPNGLLNTESQYGFVSLQQMADWLNGCSLDELYAAGGIIQIMQVRKVVVGYSQVCFKPEDVLSKKILKLHDVREICNGQAIQWPQREATVYRD